jgi:hypothetical protein
MVFSGLHHCVCELPGTFRTLAQLVLPGGLLLMVEPKGRIFWRACASFGIAQTLPSRKRRECARSLQSEPPGRVLFSANGVMAQEGAVFRVKRKKSNVTSRRFCSRSSAPAIGCPENSYFRISSRDGNVSIIANNRRTSTKEWLCQAPSQSKKVPADMSPST